MGLFVNQNDQRSKLQERLASELAEKAKRRREMAEQPPDTIDKQAYLKDTKTAGPMIGYWIGIVVLVVALLAVYVFVNQR